MKTKLTIALLLIAAIGYAQDTIPADTVQTPYTKYCIVSISDFFDLNCEMSTAKGLELGDKTARVYPLDIQHFTLIDKNPNKDVLMAVVKVNPSNQQYIGDLELFDLTEINFKDTVLLEYDIAVKNKDWVEKHYLKVGHKDKQLKIKDK